MSRSSSDLSVISLFAGLSMSERQAIADRCSFRTYAEGDVVFDRDSTALDVYFVLSGTVRILNQAGSRSVILAEMEAGRYFGELAAIDGQPRSAQAVVQKQAELACLPGRDFVQVMMSHPQIALNVMWRMTGVIRDLDARVQILSNMDSHQRVAGQLVRLAQQQGAGMVILPMPDAAELAALVAIPEDESARILADLIRKSLLVPTADGGMGVDLKGMQALAG